MGNRTIPSLAEIQRARDALRPIARETPVLPADDLSRRTGYRVLFKAENLQRTGSFKIRGAYTRVQALGPEERTRGVIASSAGNHGQGVALAARLEGIPATIVVPANAAATKVSAIQAQGARTVLWGQSFEAAYQKSRELAQSEDLRFIHPYDDWQVIAGQGSLGIEILEQVPEADALLVPIGGGGLIAGVALAAKAIKPSIKVIGVQAAGASAAVASFTNHERVVGPAETIADGIKVAEPGERPFSVMTRAVDAILAVTEEEIYRAVISLLEETKLVVEPAGAVGVAALQAGRVFLPPGSTVVALLSGGNVDPNLLVSLIDYGLVHSGRSLRLRIMLPDRPGELVRLLAPLSERRVNILDIEHHRAIWGLPVGVSEVLLHLETRGPEHCAEVIAALQDLGFAIEPIVPGGPVGAAR